MTPLDYVVLVGTILGIAAYGMWMTRGRRNLQTYLKGSRTLGWGTIGLSVMATQASAITFLSVPGQGYQDGLGFTQNYFGMPLALILIAVVLLPLYRKLNVYTAYEYLGRRFDSKTRLLGTGLFLLQRGLGAGITIYAPAIVLSTVFGWRLDLTIILSGLLVIIYTVSGGSEAVSLTQKYQMLLILAGMVAAFAVLMSKLLTHVSLADALVVAGGFHKMAAVDYSFNFGKRYTFWSGTLGGIFLFLSYFGVDQSQVQRYISGSSLRESRLGLMFNAVLKIPMQFSILLLGAMLFVFYQFERPPLFFDEAALKYRAEHGQAEKLSRLGQDFTAIQADKQAKVQAWLDARHAGNPQAEAAARAVAVAALDRSETVRKEVKDVVQGKDRRTNEADYIFIAFVLHYLPHGVIGLLVAVIFAAAMSSKASELNALGSTTTIDIYRHLVQRDASDAHYVVASKWFTALWGLFALAFALYATLSENLIQAVNILGSLFYGVLLGLFVVAFVLKWVRGTAVFIGAIAAQALIFALFWQVPDKVLSYLWYNLIGCAACMLFSVIVQASLDSMGQSPEAKVAA